MRCSHWRRLLTSQTMWGGLYRYTKKCTPSHWRSFFATPRRESKSLKSKSLKSKSLKSKPHDAFVGAITSCGRNDTVWHDWLIKTDGLLSWSRSSHTGFAWKRKRRRGKKTSDRERDINKSTSKARRRLLQLVLYRRGNREWKALGTDGRPISADWWRGRLKKNGQTKWRILRIEWVFSSFLWLCYVNSRFAATAAGRNALSSVSERESVTTQDTILSVRGEVRSNRQPFEWPAVNIRSVERQARGEHSVASLEFTPTRP